MFQTVKKSVSNKTIFLCSLGGSLELFDFIIFIYFIDVLKQVFFSNASPHMASLQTFAIFTVGYLARPLGGIFFAHFSDRLGRSKPFSLTLLFMGVPALGMALLPSYATGGIYSPLLLLFLRILQGLSVGGEYPIAITIIKEQTNEKERGYATAMLSAAACIGVLLGSAVSALMHHLFSSQDLIGWAWRLPFLLGAGLAFLGVYLRQSLSQSVAFPNHRQPASQLPIVIVIQHYYRQVLRAIGISSVISFSSFCFLFWPNFLHTYLHYPINQTLLTNTIGLILLILFTIAFGYLSLYVSRIKIYRLSGFGLILFGYPLLLLWKVHAEWSLLLSYVCFAFLFAGVNSVYSGFIAELFESSVCSTGTALAYNTTTALVCGTLPLLVTYLCQFENPLFVMLFGLLSAGFMAIGFQKGHAIVETHK